MGRRRRRVCGLISSPSATGFGSYRKLMKANTELTRNDRSEILDRVAEVVRKRFYDPQLNGVDWAGLVNQRKYDIVNSAPDQFEKALNDLLLELKTSQVGVIGARIH